MITTAIKLLQGRQSQDPTADAKWQAVVERDPSADGRFYYAVKTTRIYCRPSCCARPPLRRNVLFYDSSADAEKDGFRACKRCHPEGPTRANEHAAAVAKACRLLQTDPSLPLAVVAKKVGISSCHFHRIFKKITGLTPKTYAMGRRSDRVRDELSNTCSVTEAIYGAGYNSSGRFYAKSSETLGMNPKEYQEGGGATIHFAIGECWLGSVLVAVSQKGVCAIFLGDEPALLVKDLQHRFRKATILRGDDLFEKLLTQVIARIEEPQTDVDLPLDIRGTVFQQKVWKALREIPLGCTASYAEIADRIGLPKAVRAVAQACGANPLSVAIPCHRVVRTTGQLSGYRWGVQRKRALLEREKSAKQRQAGVLVSSVPAGVPPGTR